MAIDEEHITCDLVVIGSGSAGLTAAKFARKFDKQVVLVEKHRTGGDCTWTGCVPSKSLIKSASIAHYARHGTDYGVNMSAGNPTVDMLAVKRRIQSTIQRIYSEDDSPEVLSKLGVNVIEGTAKFTTPSSIQVLKVHGSTCSVQPRAGFLVATGARPIIPRIAGLDSVQYLTYEHIFDLESVPRRLTVVGGGPIGCELAQAFAHLGSTVTIVASKLLPRDDPDASSVIEERFSREGILRSRGRATAVEPLSDSSHKLTISSGEAVEGDVLLICAGRTPVVDGLDLEKANVLLNEASKGIAVSRSLRTSNRRVYAAGDCTGGVQFTHYAGYQGAIAARNLLMPFTSTGVQAQVPACTFTSPEVASAGLSEARARESLGAAAVRVLVKPMSEVDRAVCDGETDGFIKLICRASDLRLLGACVCGPAAGELISELNVAISAQMKLKKLASVIHPYPSYSFAIQQMAAEATYDQIRGVLWILNGLRSLGF